MPAVMISAMTKEKIWTEGSAFTIGVVNGLIGRSKPSAALLTTVVTAGGGLLGSLMTMGRMADVLEGVAAGSLGALGYSLPFWFKTPQGTTTGKVDVSGVRRIQEIAAPKALKEGTRRVASPAYAEEFQGVEVY